MELFASIGTRNAKKQLEKICPPRGKGYLEKFLSKIRKSWNRNNLMTDTNVTSPTKEFANLLDDSNIKYFKEAVKLQAKSAGTLKKGLFYTLVYNDGKDTDITKLKRFLLAKHNSDITENEEIIKFSESSTSVRNMLGENDRKTRRTKNEDIQSKAGSIRLSNKLKIFMALVYYHYLNNKAGFDKMHILFEHSVAGEPHYRIISYISLFVGNSVCEKEYPPFLKKIDKKDDFEQHLANLLIYFYRSSKIQENNVDLCAIKEHCKTEANYKELQNIINFKLPKW